MLRIIKLCMKEVEDKTNNRTFPSYFAYKVDMDKDGNAITREYPTTVTAEDGTTSTVMKAKSFKVGLGEVVEAQLKADKSQFPYIITYDDEDTDKDGKRINYIKVDKDKDKNVRLDKYGKRHAVLVLREIKNFTPAPRTEINFDDIEDFE